MDHVFSFSDDEFKLITFVEPTFVTTDSDKSVFREHLKRVEQQKLGVWVYQYRNAAGQDILPPYLIEEAKKEQIVLHATGNAEQSSFVDTSYTERNETITPSNVEKLLLQTVRTTFNKTDPLDTRFCRSSAIPFVDNDRMNELMLFVGSPLVQKLKVFGFNCPAVHVDDAFDVFPLFINDADTYRSDVIVSGGNKIWFTVDPSSYYEFVQFLRGTCPEQYELCDNPIRHGNFCVSNW